MELWMHSNAASSAATGGTSSSTGNPSQQEAAGSRGAFLAAMTGLFQSASAGSAGRVYTVSNWGSMLFQSDRGGYPKAELPMSPLELLTMLEEQTPEEAVQLEAKPELLAALAQLQTLLERWTGKGEARSDSSGPAQQAVQQPLEQAKLLVADAMLALRQQPAPEVKSQLQDAMYQLQRAMQTNSEVTSRPSLFMDGETSHKVAAETAAGHLMTGREAAPGRRSIEPGRSPLFSTGSDTLLQAAARAAGGNVQIVHAPAAAGMPIMPGSLIEPVIGASTPIWTGPEMAVEQLADKAPEQPVLQTLGLNQGKAAAQPAVQETAARTAESQVPVQRFGEEMSRFIIKTFQLSTSGQVSEARISLIPEHLGSVDVRITVQNGQLTAQFLAESAVAKEMLENQLPALRSALQSQGLQVEKLEVAAHSAGSSQFQDQRQQPFQQQSNKQSGKAKLTAYAEGTAELSEELQQIRQSLNMGYGNAFDATA